MNIVPLEKDQTLQDLVLSVFHATTHTFNATGAVKILENHLGKAFIKQAQTQTMLVPVHGPRPKQMPPQEAPQQQAPNPLA